MVIRINQMKTIYFQLKKKLIASYPQLQPCCILFILTFSSNQKKGKLELPHFQYSYTSKTLYIPVCILFSFLPTPPTLPSYTCSPLPGSSSVRDLFSESFLIMSAMEMQALFKDTAYMGNFSSNNRFTFIALPLWRWSMCLNPSVLFSCYFHSFFPKNHHFEILSSYYIPYCHHDLYIPCHHHGPCILCCCHGLYSLVSMICG